MQIPIKREQSQTVLTFAECEKFRPQEKRSRLWMIAAILLLTVATSAQTTIVIGGVVEAATGQKDGATAVVLQNGRIAYVGNDEGAMAYHNGNTEIISAAGNTIMPAMTDAHMHLYTALMAKYEISLADVIDVSEMQTIIRLYADENPDLESLTGGGWDVSVFGSSGPTKDILDAVVSDKPVALQSADGHSLWINSMGLEKLGIDKAFAKQYNDNALENGGSIVVDAEGEPTGYLKEAAANMIAALKPTYTVQQCKAALREQQEWFASLGITSAFDAGVSNNTEGTVANMYQALSEMARDRELKMKVRGSFWVHPFNFKDWNECKAYLDGWMQRIAEMGGNDYYSVNTIKMMADCVLEEATAYLSEGMYADGVLEKGDTESRNRWAGKEDMMEKIFLYAGEHGLNLHIHQIGDAAATLALDRLEKAVAAYPELKNQRVTFAHCQFISDRDKDRMSQLGVSALVAPYWAVMDDYYWDVYLPLMSSQEKLDTQYPMQSLEQRGINVAFHSDYFVTQPDMGWLYYSAMTRVLPQKIYDLWYGDDEHYMRTTDTTVSQRPEDNQDCRLIGPLKAWNEVLTLDQTIKASTINGARTLNLDDRIGTIEVGKSADIMILNMNLRTVGTEELENVSPVITFFEGEKLFVADHAATAVLPIHESAGSNQVRKIMSRGGQVLIKNGATYYNTAGCAHFRPLFNR